MIQSTYHQVFTNKGKAANQDQEGVLTWFNTTWIPYREEELPPTTMNEDNPPMDDDSEDASGDIAEVTIPPIANADQVGSSGIDPTQVVG